MSLTVETVAATQGEIYKSKVDTARRLVNGYDNFHDYYPGKQPAVNLLIGPHRSSYLRQVREHLTMLGLPVMQQDEYVPLIQSAHLIVDTDHVTSSDWTYGTRATDVDCVKVPGMSSCAEACYTLLRALDMTTRHHVVLVGNAHAVKGLATALLQADAIVTVSHALSQAVLDACASADVVVVATPRSDPVSLHTPGLILDLTHVATNTSTGPVYRGLSPLDVAFLGYRCAAGGAYYGR